MKWRNLGCTLALGVVCAGPAMAQFSGGEIRVGLFTDHEGAYSHFTGQGSVVAAQMAIDEAGGKIGNKPIKLLVADHKGSVDAAMKVAKSWLNDEGVDVIADFVGSPAALAIQEINRPKGAVLFFITALSSLLNGKNCAPTGINWLGDSDAIASITASALTKRGGSSWFMVSVDNPFGMIMEKGLTEQVQANGGKVLGSVKHPLNHDNFLGPLLKAEASGAKVIALVNAGEDTINSVKQAFELHSIAKGETILTTIAVGVSDIDRIKLPVAQGMQIPTPFYWDFDEQTRTFAKRFEQRAGRMPSEAHAGIYSAMTHYLKAAKAAQSDDGPTVVKKMRELPIKDPVLRNGKLLEDGRVIHDAYLVQVKKPAESKGRWDYYKVLQELKATPADEQQMMEKTQCPLVKKPGK